jgi:hypothetical protein
MCKLFSTQLKFKINQNQDGNKLVSSRSNYSKIKIVKDAKYWK